MLGRLSNCVCLCAKATLMGQPSARWPHTCASILAEETKEIMHYLNNPSIQVLRTFKHGQRNMRV